MYFLLYIQYSIQCLRKPGRQILKQLVFYRNHHFPPTIGTNTKFNPTVLTSFSLHKTFYFRCIFHHGPSQTAYNVSQSTKYSAESLQAPELKHGNTHLRQTLLNIPASYSNECLTGKTYSVTKLYQKVSLQSNHLFLTLISM